MFSRLSQDKIKNWCRGRLYLVRIPFLVWFGYVFVRHLQDPNYSSLLGGLNLGIHEFGHLLFTPFGEFMHMAGGTLFQCLAPVLGMINFYVQEDYFSITLCFGWLSTNFFNVATYAADARAQQIPLVTPFGRYAVHDWNYLLGRVGLLNYDKILAQGFRLLAVFSMLACFVTGLWLIGWMVTLSRE